MARLKLRIEKGKDSLVGLISPAFSSFLAPPSAFARVSLAQLLLPPLKPPEFSSHLLMLPIVLAASHVSFAQVPLSIFSAQPFCCLADWGEQIRVSFLDSQRSFSSGQTESLLRYTLKSIFSTTNWIFGCNLRSPKSPCKKRLCVTTATSRTLLASPGRRKQPNPCKVNHLVTNSTDDILVSHGPGRYTIQDPSCVLLLRWICTFHGEDFDRPSSAGMRCTRIPRCITGASAWVAVSIARCQGEERICVMNWKWSWCLLANSSHSN